METTAKIYVAGHRGMVGSAILRILRERGYSRIVYRTHEELDLTKQSDVERFFHLEHPDYVILAAAKVGGIQANIDSPAQFLYDNLCIQNNVIHQSYLNNVRKICFLGSSCIYPRDCAQPMAESSLLTGPLEPTNEGYAIAKIAGLKLIEYYSRQYSLSGISVMPCNLYGTNDSYDPLYSHVLSALVKRFVDAKEAAARSVSIWGTGKARREFMHVEDAARAIVYLMETYQSPDVVNIGWGEDVSIKELALLIAGKVCYQGDLVWDTTKPDGMPKKCLDVSRMKRLGFAPAIDLSQGIERTINEYCQIKAVAR